MYELSAILIHRGDAHSGHYFGYLRDTMIEKDWDQLIAEYS